VTVEATTGLKIQDIPVDELHADNDFNCRGSIGPGDVIDLARSMSEQGLQQPITVQPYSPEEQIATGFKYRIISGYRRYNAAAKILKWPTIPCIVRTGLSNVEARLLNLGENLHRKELNILQEAKALLNLKIAGLGQEEVSKRLDQSRGWVQVRFYLLELPEEIQKEAAAGLLTQQNIRDLYTMPSNAQRIETVKKIKDAKIRGTKTPKVSTKKTSMFAKKARDRQEIFDMMEHIQDNIGNNIGTRCMAWAAGEISDLDLYRDIKQFADAQGKPYAIPQEAVSMLSIRADESTEV
jgi:ParB/RepB/Spo0J family partition protein